MTDASTLFRESPLALDQGTLHVVEAGPPEGKPVLFLHGWPESWFSWRAVMRLASAQARAIAIDLPGIGGSRGVATDGSKREVGGVVRRLVSALGLRDLTLVGHDVGGMVVYDYLREHSDLARAVILNVAVPGVDPWDEVVRNPAIWHFALHAVPGLPERLILGRQEVYFAFFYNALCADPAKIPSEARATYVEAYSTESALTAAFGWYRTIQQDAERNRQAAGRRSVSTPLLYLRGQHERGDIGAYASGLRAAGLTHVERGVIPGAGHFAPEEAPEATWVQIGRFAGLLP